MEDVVVLDQVSKSYKDFKLDRVSFKIKKGYIHAFIGRNGAGKTTTIKLMMNLMDVIAWYLAVFFPMYYGLGPRFVQIGMFAFLVMLSTVAPMVYNLGVKHNFWGLLEFIGSLPPVPLYLMFTAVTLAALAGSWLASVWLYSRKEF